MSEGKSHSTPSGTLYIVATPIGNLEDLTLRALRILRQVSFIACEDTRHILKLLNKYHIKKKLISYFHPRENQKIPQIIRLLHQGKNGALVSNAGTPGISDPGYPLIIKAQEKGIKIVPIPGPTALTSALSAAGLPAHRFLFLGFPPRKKTAIKKLLSSIKEEPGTIIFYLPPRKVTSFLQLIQEILGEREVVMAREMTKMYEEFLRGTPQQLLEKISPLRKKGEATLLIRGTK